MKGQLETLEKQRARHAMEEIQAWRKRHAKDFSDLATRLKGLPVTLRSEGLITTLAILLKGKTSADENRASMDISIANAIARWLAQTGPRIGLKNDPSGRELLEKAIELDNLQYRIIQREALAYLEHLKLIAEVMDNDAD